MIKLEQAFEGDKNNRGRLWSIEPNGKKNGSLEKKPFDWELHFKGDEDIQNIQGLSPVNLDTGTVKWLGLDVDLKIAPTEFCGKVFSILGPQYFCFRTTGKKWRVVEFFDEPIDVDVASKKAKELEARMEKVVGYECDKGHTLPQSYNLEEKRPGGWWYMPYCTKDTVCYSPGGIPLSKSKTEYRLKYKHLPLVVASIGMKEPGRHKSLLAVALCNEHLEAKVDLIELNNNFEDKLTAKLDNDIKHVENQQKKYDKKYLLNATPKWCEEICGVRPYLDAKGFSAVTKTLADDYLYVRSRKSFYERSTFEFVDGDQMNDYWLHIDKRITKALLEEASFNKVKKYLTHPGLDEGVVFIPKGLIPGVEEGEYLNIYKPSGVEAIKGDVTRINKYYETLCGKEAWLVVKQYMAFMLRAREEIEESGIKAQWFIIFHSTTQGLGKGLLAQIMQSLFGERNVRPNVAFKSLTNNHSTLIEGAQLIVLNEVVLTNSTGDMKEMSEEFKNLITDPNLIINPKNKPQIEIPNQCAFWVLSNSDKPLFLTEKDRRAFVINMKTTKEEGKELLINQGYKKDIIAVLNNPSAFKWHLLNEVEYDREMFFDDAPMNKDKEAMILANRTEFEKKMDMALEERSFPFGNYLMMSSKNEPIGERYIYKGIFNIKHLLRNLEAHPEFKKGGKMYYGLDEVTAYVKSICIPFPNGENTKQMELKNGTRPRVYLREQNWTLKDGAVPLSRATPQQLGELWELEPGHEDQYLDKVIPNLPNYQDIVFKPKKYESRCWNCGKEIELNNSTKCEECDYAIKCPECEKCACDKPGSSIKKKMDDWHNRKNSR